MKRIASFAFVCFLGCHHSEAEKSTQAAAASPSASAAPSPIQVADASRAVEEPERVFIESFPDEGAFVLRGSKAKGQAILLGGICAQPQYYVQSIQLAAARHTQLVALRGDKPCNGDYRGWSFDIGALSRRIDRTFRALGLGEPHDVLLIGYSQGAVVAERLAAREPEKFTRFVLMASPVVPSAAHFAKTAVVVTMAGTRDAQDDMKAGAAALGKAGIRSRYFPLPGAAHGYMGTDPEGTFENVLTWLDPQSGD